MATCQPIAPALPQVETRDSCPLSSNYMLATRMSLKFNSPSPQSIEAGCDCSHFIDKKTKAPKGKV